MITVTEPIDLPLVAQCRLDIHGLRRQRDRYRALGRHATAAVRQPQQLMVRFDSGVNASLLMETIDVERGCCPFFEMQPHLERHELVISVPHPEQDPALDAIADAVGVVASRIDQIHPR
jgi:hypothetical protein